MSAAQKADQESVCDAALNILVNGKPLGGLGNSEASWHSDMTYVSAPSCEHPARYRDTSGGGDTYFANNMQPMKPYQLNSKIGPGGLPLSTMRRTQVGSLRRVLNHLMIHVMRRALFIPLFKPTRRRIVRYYISGGESGPTFKLELVTNGY